MKQKSKKQTKEATIAQKVALASAIDMEPISDSIILSARIKGMPPGTILGRCAQMVSEGLLKYPPDRTQKKFYDVGELRTLYGHPPDWMPVASKQAPVDNGVHGTSAIYLKTAKWSLKSAHIFLGVKVDISAAATRPVKITRTTKKQREVERFKKHLKLVSK